MTGFNEEDIQKVREASDLVALIGEHTPLKQRGHDFWCCCPFHNETTPSFKIDPALQLWHCFGCGEGGDVFSFVMKTQDITFPEAVRYLADRAHIEMADSNSPRHTAQSKKARLKAVCAQTAQFYHTCLMQNPRPDAARAREYLTSRGLGGSVPKTWQLGFAPGYEQLVHHLSALGFSADEMIGANVALARNGVLRDRFYNRVIFPINNPQGECIAFGGRVLGKGEPKYLNSQETPLFHKSQVLYGIDKAKAAMASTGTAVVCEGYTDVIALHEAGIHNAVATLGTALTLSHIRLLSRHAKRRIVYLFDGDEAGRRAADRALSFIGEGMTPETGSSKIELYAATLPDNLDPADFVNAHGGKALQDLVEQAPSLIAYGIQRRLSRYNLNQAEERASALSDALSVLAPIKNTMLAHDYARTIASLCHTREDAVLDLLAKLKHVPAPKEDDKPYLGSYSGAKTGAAAYLSETERNRYHLEQQMLAHLAAHPDLALAYVGVLAQTNWHKQIHGEIAQSMLDILLVNPGITAADMVSEIGRHIEFAASVLTEVEDASQDVAHTVSFLAEELALGDIEDTLSDLKVALANPSNLSDEEYEILFETATTMQADFIRRRRAHW